MMTRNMFWMTFDLGIDGDYDTLHQWLDMMRAKECGDTSSLFRMEPNSEKPYEEVLKSLKQFGVKFRPKDRVYLIYKRHDEQVVGRFIIGRRRNAPWLGSYVPPGTQEEEDA